MLISVVGKVIVIVPVAGNLLVPEIGIVLGQEVGKVFVPARSCFWQLFHSYTW